MLDPDTLRVMARWPDVPAVTGWLTLDGTGRWYIRGQRIKHPLILAHIQSHYDCDAAGRWFFQNGPQRVFVSLEKAPHVLQALGDADSGFRDQCARRLTHFERAVLDEDGQMYLLGEYGLGYVLDQDLPMMMARLCDLDGETPHEAALFTALDAFMAAISAEPAPAPSLAWRNDTRLLPLEGCRRDILETRFGFQKEPRL